MSIKTEQLDQLLGELDVHLKKLEVFPRDQPHLTVLEFRNSTYIALDSIRDCIIIIASIVSETK